MKVQVVVITILLEYDKFIYVKDKLDENYDNKKNMLI